MHGSLISMLEILPPHADCQNYIEYLDLSHLRLFWCIYFVAKRVLYYSSNIFYHAVVDIFALGANLREPDWMKEQREIAFASSWMQKVVAEEPELQRFVSNPMKVTLDLLTEFSSDAMKEML